MGAFEPWYESEHPHVITALTVVVGDVDLAVEATDEAFVRAYERWERVSRLSSPTGWVYRTALNVVRRRIRRATKERELLERRAPAPRPPADWSIELWDALLALPPRERTALALRYVADLPGNEIAEAMGIRVGTVWSTLDHARQRLRVLLEDAPGEEVRHG